MDHHPRHSVSVAGVVLDPESRILAIKRKDSGEWQIPGGILEAKEPLESGVRREILEETGIEVDVERLTGVYKHLNLDVVALVYLCTPTGGIAMPTSEALEVAWLTLEEVRNRFSKVFSLRVEDSLSGETWSRNHDGISFLS